MCDIPKRYILLLFSIELLNIGLPLKILYFSLIILYTLLRLSYVSSPANVWSKSPRSKFCICFMIISYIPTYFHIFSLILFFSYIALDDSSPVLQKKIYVKIVLLHIFKFYFIHFISSHCYNTYPNNSRKDDRKWRGSVIKKNTSWSNDTITANLLQTSVWSRVLPGAPFILGWSHIKLHIPARVLVLVQPNL